MQCLSYFVKLNVCRQASLQSARSSLGWGAYPVPKIHETLRNHFGSDMQRTHFVSDRGQLPPAVRFSHQPINLLSTLHPLMGVACLEDCDIQWWSFPMNTSCLYCLASNSEIATSIKYAILSIFG